MRREEEPCRRRCEEEGGGEEEACLRPAVRSRPFFFSPQSSAGPAPGFCLVLTPVSLLWFSSLDHQGTPGVGMCCFCLSCLRGNACKGLWVMMDRVGGGGRTCGSAGPWGPGGLGGGAVEEVVSLQEAVEGAKDGGLQDNGQWDGPSPGQRGEDKAPADQQEQNLDFQSSRPPRPPQQPHPTVPRSKVT